MVFTPPASTGRKAGTAWGVAVSKRYVPAPFLIYALQGLHPQSILKEDWSHLFPPEALSPQNWRHPAISSIRPVIGLSDRTRMLALCATNTAHGNLSGLAQAWTYLDPMDHGAGLEVMLGTVLNTGFHRVHNGLLALHSQGVCRDAIQVTPIPSVLPSLVYHYPTCHDFEILPLHQRPKAITPDFNRTTP